MKASTRKFHIMLWDTFAAHGSVEGLFSTLHVQKQLCNESRRANTSIQLSENNQSTTADSVQEKYRTAKQ